jgi:hypothetical protein
MVVDSFERHSGSTRRNVGGIREQRLGVSGEGREQLGVRWYGSDKLWIHAYPSGVWRDMALLTNVGLL